MKKIVVVLIILTFVVSSCSTYKASCKTYNGRTSSGVYSNKKSNNAW